MDSCSQMDFLNFQKGRKVCWWHKVWLTFICGKRSVKIKRRWWWMKSGSKLKLYIWCLVLTWSGGWDRGVDGKMDCYVMLRSLGSERYSLREGGIRLLVKVVTKTEKVFVTEEKNMSELHLPYQASGGEWHLFVDISLHTIIRSKNIICESTKSAKLLQKNIKFQIITRLVVDSIKPAHPFQIVIGIWELGFWTWHFFYGLRMTHFHLDSI